MNTDIFYLNLEGSSDFYTFLTEQLANDEKTIRINCEQLDEVQVVGLQLLLAFKKKLSEKDRAIEWLNNNDELIQTAQLAGLYQPLGLDMISNDEHDLADDILVF